MCIRVYHNQLRKYRHHHEFKKYHVRHRVVEGDTTGTSRSSTRNRTVNTVLHDDDLSAATAQMDGTTRRDELFVFVLLRLYSIHSTLDLYVVFVVLLKHWYTYILPTCINTGRDACTLFEKHAKKKRKATKTGITTTDQGLPVKVCRCPEQLLLLLLLLPIVFVLEGPPVAVYSRWCWCRVHVVVNLVGKQGVVCVCVCVCFDTLDRNSTSWTECLECLECWDGRMVEPVVEKKKWCR